MNRYFDFIKIIFFSTRCRPREFSMPSLVLSIVCVVFVNRVRLMRSIRFSDDAGFSKTRSQNNRKWCNIGIRIPFSESLTFTGNTCQLSLVARIFSRFFGARKILCNSQNICVCHMLNHAIRCTDCAVLLLRRINCHSL